MDNRVEKQLTYSCLVILNPMDTDYITSGAATPTGADTPSNTVSPPPSYHDIPGTVPAHQGVSRGPPPSYEEAVDPNGNNRFLIYKTL